MLKVVRLGEMDADQTVDSVREAELLANLDNEYIVKVDEDFILFFCYSAVVFFVSSMKVSSKMIVFA